MCSVVQGNPYPAASSLYTQAVAATTIQVAPLTIGGTPCNNPKCQNERCDGTCMPEVVQAVYKTNSEIPRFWRAWQIINDKVFLSKIVRHNYCCLIKEYHLIQKRMCKLDVNKIKRFPSSAQIEKRYIQRQLI